MKPKTLYRKGKGGQMVQWTVWTNGPEIHTESGQVGGKLTPSMKVAKGKNIGRANETSPTEQAEKEAQAMYKKRLEGKYSESMDAAESPVFLPMLAHPFDKVKKVSYPADIQPKLNGVRCLASWNGSSIQLMSRGGKDYDIPHLREDIAKFLPDDLVLDGEIYLHGATFQQVTRLVKKFRPGPEGTAALQLWVYDLFEKDNIEMPWRKRRGALTRLKIGRVKSIVKVGYQTVTTEAEVLRAQAIHVQEGYEGGIVRLHDGKYELGHRSRALLKVKNFVDDDYLIVGFESGVGKFEDCVIWVCQTADGREFKVVPKGTLAEKREMLKEAPKHVGEMLTVKYFELTEDGVPQFPVGLGLRAD